MCKTRLFLWILLPAALTTLTWAHLDGPPPGFTGAPGEGTCADTGCHDTYEVNSGPGRLTVTPVQWIGSDTLVFDVRLEGTTGGAWGFESVVRVPGSLDEFELVISDPTRTQLVIVDSTTEYVTQTLNGAQPVSPDSVPFWRFRVFDKLQFSDLPCPYVFVSAVAANGDGSAAGDYVYTTWQLFSIHSCTCPTEWYLMGDVNESGSVTSADIIELINIVFKGGTMELPCALADVNCSHAINSADIIFMVNHVFRGAAGPCNGCYSLLNLEC